MLSTVLHSQARIPHMTLHNGKAPAYRTERDTFGPIDVPARRLWGAQTQRSLQHFAISGERMAPELIRALAQVKRASAYVNHSLGLLDATRTTAIVAACDEVMAGAHEEEFPLVVWQTGSGTQTNMNMNEVLANRASELLSGPRGEEQVTRSLELSSAGLARICHRVFGRRILRGPPLHRRCHV